MLMYVMLFIIILIIIFIVSKKNKKTSIEYSLKHHHVSPTQNNQIEVSEIVHQHNIHTSKSSLDIQKKIITLINDRNFFAAETLIHESLKKESSSHELYLLLLDIHLMQKDEVAINGLCNQLRILNLDDILDKIKAKIRANNIQEIESIDFILPQVLTTNKNSTNYQDKKNIQSSSPTEITQTDQISSILKRAESYIQSGHYDEARKLIAQFEKNYNDQQRNQANQLLKKIAY